MCWFGWNVRCFPGIKYIQLINKKNYWSKTMIFVKACWSHILSGIDSSLKKLLTKLSILINIIYYIEENRLWQENRHVFMYSLGRQLLGKLLKIYRCVIGFELNGQCLYSNALIPLQYTALQCAIVNGWSWSVVLKPTIQQLY